MDAAVLLALAAALAAGVNAWKLRGGGSDGLPWVGDWDSYVESKALAAGIGIVTMRELADRVPSAVLDARPRELYRAGHVPGAWPCPAGKEKLTVLFHVNRMTAKSGIKERIISQFPVKRLMMAQLHNLGNISYVGSFRVIRKEERFWGTLGTAVGSLKFQFWLDERNKYVVGNASTRKLHFGKVMGMKNVGPLAAKADFKIDISKPRTAAMRRKLGGKLPIGAVNATIDDCSYKGVHVRNVAVTVNSNGAEATGDVIQRGNWRDISCSFSFTDTNQMHKLKVSRGRMKFHKMTDEAKQAKRERKEARKAERQAKRDVKKAEKSKKKSFLFF